MIRNGVTVPGPNMPPRPQSALTAIPVPAPEPLSTSVVDSFGAPDPAVLSGTPLMPGGEVPIIGVPDSKDYPRLAFTAPYFIPGAPQLTGGIVNGPLTVNQPFTNPATANYWSTQTPPANIARLGDRVLIGAEAQRYDGTGQFGTSTSNTWVATIVNRVFDYLEIQGRLLSYSTPGVVGEDSRTISAVFASKTSDLSSDQSCCVIPVTALGYNDNTINPSDCWLYYATGVRMANTGTLQNEIDIANAGEYRGITPFGATQAPLPGGHSAGLTIGMVINSGGEPADATPPLTLNPASTAVWIGYNGARWDKGITFDINGLVADKAICLGNGHALCWYDSAGGSGGADAPYAKLQAFDDAFGSGMPGVQVNGAGLQVAEFLQANSAAIYAGTLGAVPPAGNVIANVFNAFDTSATFVFQDRADSSFSWHLYSTGYVARFNNGTSGDVLTLNAGGQLNPHFGYMTQPGPSVASDGHAFNISFPNPAHLWIDSADMGSINTTPCDERLKKNLAEPTVDALAAINAIALKQFDWIANEVVPEHHEDIGFTAQQLNEAIPNAVTVHEDPDAMLSVQLTPIVAHLIGAVQQLSERLETLEMKLVALG